MKGFFHEIYHNKEKPMSTKFVKTVDIVFHQFVQICSKNLDAGILPMTQFLTKKILNGEKTMETIFYKTMVIVSSLLK